MQYSEHSLLSKLEQIHSFQTRYLLSSFIVLMPALLLIIHLARHTFATTVCLSNDVPIETLSKMLGHRSIRTTQIYAKITAEKVSRDMEKLSQRIEQMENFICQTI